MLTWWAVGTWAVAAIGGLAMAVLFLRHNGMRQSERDAIGPLRVFPHVGAAVVGFVLWVIYAVDDNDAFGWAAVVAICIAFLIAGTFLVTRDQHRRRELDRLRGRSASAGVGTDAPSAAGIPAESNLPVVLASGHGLLGAGTLILVPLQMAGVGGS